MLMQREKPMEGVFSVSIGRAVDAGRVTFAVRVIGSGGLPYIQAWQQDGEDIDHIKAGESVSKALLALKGVS